MDDCVRHVEQLGRVLDSVSYRRVLERGFVLVYGPDGEPVVTAAQTSPGMPVDLRFRDNDVSATIGHGAASRGKKKKPGEDGGSQGSLL